MSDLFLNFDLQLAYTKLKSVCGKTKRGEGRCMIECDYNNGIPEKWIWFAGLKFIIRKGAIEIRDMDYGYMVDARIVTNERYLHKIADIIAREPNEVLWRNRSNRNFFRSRIRGIGRFTDNPHVKQEVIDAIKSRCLTEHPMDLAAEFEVSEFLVRKLRAEQKDAVR